MSDPIEAPLSQLPLGRSRGRKTGKNLVFALRRSCISKILHQNEAQLRSDPGRHRPRPASVRSGSFISTVFRGARHACPEKLLRSPRTGGPRSAYRQPWVSALGGLVADDSIVASAPFLERQDVPLVHVEETDRDHPTVVENGCRRLHGIRTLSLAEVAGSIGFAVITLGAGVGYGLVIHDGIVVDSDSGIGLVGDWPLDSFGPLCPAGHRGRARSILTRLRSHRPSLLAIDRGIDDEEDSISLSPVSPLRAERWMMLDGSVAC